MTSSRRTAGPTTRAGSRGTTWPSPSTRRPVRSWSRHGPTAGSRASGAETVTWNVAGTGGRCAGAEREDQPVDRRRADLPDRAGRPPRPTTGRRPSRCPTSTTGHGADQGGGGRQLLLRRQRRELHHRAGRSTVGAGKAQGSRSPKKRGHRGRTRSRPRSSSVADGGSGVPARHRATFFKGARSPSWATPSPLAELKRQDDQVKVTGTNKAQGRLRRSSSSQWTRARTDRRSGSPAQGPRLVYDSSPDDGRWPSSGPGSRGTHRYPR